MIYITSNSKYSLGLLQLTTITTVQSVRDNLTLSAKEEQVLVHSPLKKRLKVFDSEGIVMGNEFSDDEINFAQQLLKEQFNKLNGLQSTLLQAKQLNLTESETSNKFKSSIAIHLTTG